MDIHRIIKNLGLFDKEAAIYLAALNLGTASITDLSKKAELKRPTAYLVIDELLKKHLLIKVPQGKKFFYKAENPQILIRELNNKKAALLQALPNLKMLYNRNSQQPKIRFYEGKDKIQMISEETFSAKEIWALFSPNKFLKHFNHKDNKHLFRILIRHGGIIYDLLEDTPQAREFSRAKYRCGVSEVKFLPKKMRFATDLLLWDNKVALVSFDNLTAVVIEDQSIAQMQRLMLQFIWQQID